MTIDETIEVTKIMFSHDVQMICEPPDYPSVVCITNVDGQPGPNAVIARHWISWIRDEEMIFKRCYRGPDMGGWLRWEPLKDTGGYWADCTEEEMLQATGGVQRGGVDRGIAGAHQWAVTGAYFKAYSV